MNALEATRDGDAPVRFALDGTTHRILGREPGADLRYETETYLGRRHVEIWVHDGRLAVRALAGARNPVFFHGTAQQSFVVDPDDAFVIGRTRFVFRTTGHGGHDTPEPANARTLSAEEVFGPEALAARLRLRDLLELPEILSSKRPEEFHLHIARLLRLSTGARWACVAGDEGTILSADDSGPPPAGRQLSRSLIAAALASAPRPTLYRWGATLAETAGADIDWAICAAVARPREPALLLYTAGSAEDAARPEALEEASRFVGLVADMVSRALAVRQLEVWTERLGRYFSGPVVDRIVASRDPAELEPRLADSTVMFFDLRGFSKRTEGQNEKIMEYLGELKRIMTAMTDVIFAEQGVVLHYLGDGILACWNVPIPCADHVDRACRAALAMVEGLHRLEGGWQCGIGLHTGEVVAGAIGSEQVFSYSVMGSVVNQASRIEGITKTVESPVLVTRAVADRVSPAIAVPVRVGRFMPAGMNTALDLFELLPPPGDPGRQTRFAAGLASFERGDWEAAYALLDPLGPGDRPARYLKSLAEMHRRHPPKDWQGVIELTGK